MRQSLCSEVCARWCYIISSTLPDSAQVFVQLLCSFLDDRFGIVNPDISSILLLKQRLIGLKSDKIALTR